MSRIITYYTYQNCNFTYFKEYLLIQKNNFRFTNKLTVAYTYWHNFEPMQSFINLIIHAILLCAGFFGIYATTRLLRLRKTHVFYMFWLLSHSVMFLMYFFIKNGTFDDYPFFYRALSPIYFFAPGSLYLFFTSITRSPKSKMEYLLHLSPIIITTIFTFIQVYFFRDNLFENIRSFQLQIRFPNQTYSRNTFQIEKVLFAVRSLLALIYVIIIDKELKKAQNQKINESWRRIFKPIRINVYLVITILVPHQILRAIFHSDIGNFFFLNAIVIIAAFMFFKHVVLLLKDLESSNSIFKMQETATSPTLDIPEKSLFILHQIYKEQLYLDPLLSIGKVASIFATTEEKFSLLFNNTIPFSFSSYINYLRLMHYEDSSNNKFSKEANIINAGFNSRASYYQWEKRMGKLANQINPILEAINHKSEPVK